MELERHFMLTIRSQFTIISISTILLYFAFSKMHTLAKFALKD